MQPPSPPTTYRALQTAWDALDFDDLTRTVDDLARLSKNLLSIATQLGRRHERTQLTRQQALLDAAMTRLSDQVAGLVRVRLPAWLARVNQLATQVEPPPTEPQ